MSHCCTEFAYDVSCIIGTYFNGCVKLSATDSVSDPGGRILTSFQYLRDELSHGQYVGRLIPPSLQNILDNMDSEREEATRHDREPNPDPSIFGRVAPYIGLGGNRGGAPPGQRRGGVDGEPFPNPFSIQCLRLLPGDNTCGVFQNIALPILGGAELCKHWNLGFYCFIECPRKGSHIHPSTAVADKVTTEMASAWSPVVGAVRITQQ